MTLVTRPMLAVYISAIQGTWLQVWLVLTMQGSSEWMKKIHFFSECWVLQCLREEKWWQFINVTIYSYLIFSVQKKNVNLQGGSIFFLSWGRTGGPSPLSPYIARLRPAYSFLRHQPHSSAASGFSTPGISLIILGPQHSPREQEEGSSVSKQFIGAPGLGVYGEP